MKNSVPKEEETSFIDPDDFEQAIEAELDAEFRHAAQMDRPLPTWR